MPRFDLKATELTDTDVNFVALVKRGANRIPFRITKKDDEPMLDLYKIGRQMFQKADRAPRVVAIVAGKANPNAAVVAALAKACGLPETLQKSEDDGVSTFAVKDGPIEGAVLVKLDADWAVAIKGSEMLQKMAGDRGFVVSLGVARRDLNAVMKEAIAKAEHPVEAAEASPRPPTTSAPTPSSSASTCRSACSRPSSASAPATPRAGRRPIRRPATAWATRPTARPARPTPARTAPAQASSSARAPATDDRATSDDKDTEIDAKPGASVSGDNSGMPAGAKAPTRKSAAIKTALAAIADALAKFDGDGDEDDAMVSDDASTNGAQGKLPAKAKAPTQKGLGGGAGGEHKTCPTNFPPRPARARQAKARPRRSTIAPRTRPKAKRARPAARSQARPRARRSK